MALLVTRVGWAQIDAKAIEHELKGTKMALRSYSAEPVTRYEWVNDKLVATPGHLFTLGVFATQSVKLKGNLLIVDGNRSTLVRDPDKNVLALTGEAPMSLEIDLRNAPTTLVLPMLANMLFFPDTVAAVAGLPIPQADWLPANSSGLKLSGSMVSCHCKMMFDGRQWTEVAPADPRYSVPKLKSWVEPEFTDKGRVQRISGAVAVQIYVDSTGHVEDVWLGRLLGFGLDENAVKTVRQYVFDPATYDGRPVGTALVVEVNYQSR